MAAPPDPNNNSESDAFPHPDDEISSFDMDSNSPPEGTSLSDEARAVFESQRRNFRQEIQESRSSRSGNLRNESAPARLRRRPDTRLLCTAPVKIGGKALTDHTPLVEFLRKEGQMPDKEWTRTADDASTEIGKLFGGYTPDAVMTPTGWVDPEDRAEDDNITTVFPTYKVIDALTVPCRDEDLEVIMIGTVIPSTFLDLTWERLDRYRRLGGRARPFKMEENHMILEVIGLPVSIRYRQVTTGTFDMLHSQLDRWDALPNDVNPHEVYSNAVAIDRTVVTEINEFITLNRRALKICSGDYLDTFQLMYIFLRYWAIQRGLYSNPGRPLHDLKLLNMILILPNIMSFSQGICSFFAYHNKCTPLNCAFDYNQSPHYQTNADAALWNCWSQRLHREIHIMHETLNRKLGVAHVCNGDVHDWVAFLNECSLDAEYNKADVHRIVVELQYTNNSPMLGRKLLDIMDEQVPVLHRFLHSESLYQDCRVWPQRLTETHELYRTSPFRCFWVFSVHKADRDAGAQASYDAIEDWLFEWKKMIAKKYKNVGGSSNYFFLNTSFYEPRHEIATLKPDLRTLPRQEVKPPTAVASRFKDEDEYESSSREVSSSSDGPFGAAPMDGEESESQANRHSQISTAFSAAHGSSSSKSGGNTRAERQTESVIADAMKDLDLDEHTKTVGKGKKPYGKVKGKSNDSSSEDQSSHSKSPGQLVEMPGNKFQIQGKGSKRKSRVFDLLSSASSSRSSSKPAEEEPVKKSLMEASKILNRLRTDSALNIDNYEIGYKDRFNRTKLQWKSAIEWDTETTAENFIPEWKIQQFKDVSKDLVVWDKDKKLDLLTNKEGYY